jgi:hypothetical protein
VNIVCHLQSVGPEVGSNCVGPPVSCVYHHGASKVLNVSDPFLGNSVLEMRVYATVGDSLTADSYITCKEVFGKAAIVGMVVLDADSIVRTVGLELAFALQGFFGGRGLLDVNLG